MSAVVACLAFLALLVVDVGNGVKETGKFVVFVCRFALLLRVFLRGFFLVVSGFLLGGRLVFGTRGRCLATPARLLLLVVRATVAPRGVLGWSRPAASSSSASAFLLGVATSIEVKVILSFFAAVPAT